MRPVNNQKSIEFKAYSTIYQAIFDLLTATNVKLRFAINKELCEKYEASAIYNTDSCAIYFKAPSYIEEQYLREEMIHAAQHHCFYKDKMKYANKNCEFEAKVCQDIVNSLYNSNNIYYVREIPTISDNRQEFIDIYSPWIEHILEIRCFLPSEVYNFQSICETWKGYSKSFSADFKPELLDKYFRKPPVDHM